MAKVKCSFIFLPFFRKIMHSGVIIFLRFSSRISPDREQEATNSITWLIQTLIDAILTSFCRHNWYYRCRRVPRLPSTSIIRTNFTSSIIDIDRGPTLRSTKIYISFVVASFRRAGVTRYKYFFSIWSGDCVRVSEAIKEISWRCVGHIAGFSTISICGFEFSRVPVRFKVEQEITYRWWWR